MQVFQAHFLHASGPLKEHPFLLSDSTLVVHNTHVYDRTSQFKRADDTLNKKKKVIFFSKFCLQNHFQKRHASYKDSSVICNTASATAGHQITTLERIILSA